MDKIYSRKRFLIPKIKSKGKGLIYNKINNLQIQNDKIGKHGGYEKIINRKMIKVAVIIVIAIVIANRIIATIEPIMDVLCIDMAKSISTKIANEQATIVMRKL